MRCERCQGGGRIMVEAAPILTEAGFVCVADWLPCPDCGGAGLVSCCEGTERHAGVAGVAAPPFGASPETIAPLLRGEAREHDGAAFELLGRLGFTSAAIAAALPQARAAQRAAIRQPGA